MSVIDPTEQLVQMCKTTRQAYYEVARTRSRMAAAIVRAQAMQQALATANNKDVCATLLAMADPKIKMVERIGEPSDVDVVNVMLMATWHGFTPGDSEFSVLAGRGGATMYIKGNGYKTLMVDLGAKDIRIQPGFPKQVNFKDGGGSVWMVEGTAECVFNGQKIRLLFSGDGAVKVPCNLYRGQQVSSDGIDLVIGKADRRMAKALYGVVHTAAKVAAAEDADDDATGNAEMTITPVAPAALPAPAPDFIDEVAALQTKLTSEHATLLGDAHADIAGAVSQQQLRTVWEAVNAAARESKLDKRAVDLLVRIKDAKKGELQ